MSKFDERIQRYTAQAKKMKLDIDPELLHKITLSLGPSIYRRDAELVSCSDPKELARIKENFLIKKLGLRDGPKLDKVLKEVCDEYGLKTKYRAIFYLQLIKKIKPKITY